MRLNKSQVVELLGCSMQRISTLIAQGLPVLQRGSRGKDWAFDGAAIVEWVRQQEAAKLGDTGEKLDPDQAKARKDQAQAELAELELAKRRGALIEVAKVEAMMAGDYAFTKQRMLAMPSKVAPLLSVITEPAEIQAILYREVSDSLNELAAANDVDERELGRLDAAGPEEGEAAASATAESDGERVGRHP